MFGFLKPRMAPEGPVQFDLQAEIDRPAEEVYPLLDWADERNAKRALGNSVARIGSSPDRFRMLLDLVPGHEFEMTVTEAVPAERYAFESTITPRAGQLVSAHEAYRLLRLGERSCRLCLTMTATFVGGMRMKAFERELAIMTTACGNALAKLKMQAEYGVEAVREIEAMQMA
jgi:hypothetical protein